MLFNSQAFILGFLPLVLAGYYALARHRAWRQAWVVLASLGFYGWWDVRFVPLLVGLTLANWLIAQWFGIARRGWIPVLGVALNLLALGVFKYADFIRGSVYGLVGAPWTPWALVLPLGISFFVFQKISYLIDLKRGDKHIYGFLDFWMFVTFFPQLIAGPLVRHNEIIPQFDNDPRRPEIWENLSRGCVLFIIGIAKKVALADTLAQIADPIFAHAAAAKLTAAEGWIGDAAYTMQIYFDFSGYSDMAIGLALMFGLRLPFNFNAPYRSTSIRDFWRRWHMTLSRFLRDYLYIPLGGNRCSLPRQAVNIFAHHAARRPVARRGLDVRRLGRAARLGAGAEPCVGEERDPPAAASRLGDDAAVRHGCVRAVPLAELHRGRQHVGGDGGHERSGRRHLRP